MPKVPNKRPKFKTPYKVKETDKKSNKPLLSHNNPESKHTLEEDFENTVSVSTSESSSVSTKGTNTEKCDVLVPKESNDDKYVFDSAKGDQKIGIPNRLVRKMSHKFKYLETEELSAEDNQLVPNCDTTDQKTDQTPDYMTDQMVKDLLESDEWFDDF